MSNDNSPPCTEEAPRPLSEMRLRGLRPPVTRLSRKVLLTLGVVAAVALGGAVMVALRPTGRTGHAELYNTDSHPAPDALARLPRDYAGLPPPSGWVPKLGPPMPGDLGRPFLAAGATPPPIGPQATGENVATTPPPNPEIERVAQEHEAARTSRLFSETGRSAESATPSLASFGAGEGAGTTVAPAAPSNTEGEKEAFLARTFEEHTVSANRLEPPASADVLQAGSIIPAALITGLRSDLPGMVTAQVTEDVYDTPTGKRRLIPQGSKLIGQYDAQVSFGQSCALLVWTRLILPNGKSIVLERQPATDPAGYAGLQDRVNNHWGTLLSSALLSTVLSVGAEAGAGSNDSALVQALRQGAGQGINQAGQQVVSRSLNVAPTLTIRPGYPVRVLVTRDLVLELYDR